MGWNGSGHIVGSVVLASGTWGMLGLSLASWFSMPVLHLLLFSPSHPCDHGSCFLFPPQAFKQLSPSASISSLTSPQ